MFDKFFGWFVVTVIVATVIFMTIMIPLTIERDTRAEQIAKEHGCEYIGHARDLGSVQFMECDGEIKAYRVKLK